MTILLFLPFPTHDNAATKKAVYSATLAKIDTILKDERLAGAITGVSIRNAVSGELIYSPFGDTRLHPASNMKLLTAASALEVLGKDYQFSTEVWIDGKIEGNTLVGNVYLKGKGDPTLMKADLDQFAKDLKAKGIHKIDGNLIGDDLWYDHIRLSQDLNWSDETNYTGSQVSALTLSPDHDYDSGTVIVEVFPAKKVGKHANVKVTPATNYVEIRNETETVEGNAQKKITIEREHGTNVININGTIPFSSNSEKAWVAVWEPTEYTLDVFLHALIDAGFKISNSLEVKTGSTPEDAQLLTIKKSMPLEDLLVPFMKLSNNGHGETLTKEMGKVVHGEGSWNKGLQVMKGTVVKFGVNGETILLRDGSGMSHKNLISANELSQLLYTIQEKAWFPEFEASLPVAGDSDRLVGGTLRTRMKEEPVKGNVKAKTGSITGVSTISGYVIPTEGEPLIFSIMINNYLGHSVREIEDSIVQTLVEGG
ncbi:D-alanyl-D-alanine carboxypeptidase/D-alanyl-D-alanine-endopeptidase [Bacillus sp. B15-48]|uniref:D-alanyl-D-alanine carboxypeptidase/D-alanyl-D-alanine endopeptidase n=1 Tax=Bacillus sp. B15-48 TaxID=1548601 RepID=UPI001EF37A1F|nr:D-alanyl-D-alanine carboxypeptidase/D-alanyl-D-alanine-endopeptidase [Bacillus sp. B15-48]